MRGTSAPWLRGYARAPTGLHRGLDGALSAVSARPVVGGVRLHRRAPGAGISAGAATGGSRAAGSSDGMSRCTAADPTAQGGR
jgi:hypothetical protein